MIIKIKDLNYSITGLELSDLFFDFTTNDQVSEPAKEFLNLLPSLKNKGITEKDLIADYKARL